MKLIFVDDSSIWRDDVREVAEARGISIQTYALPTDVDFEQLSTTDAVITDNKFGGHGYLGVSFIQSLRSCGYTGQVVLYTNNPRQDDKREVENLGGIVVEKSTFPDKLVVSLGCA